jgi:hypothetical protein
MRLYLRFAMMLGAVVIAAGPKAAAGDPAVLILYEDAGSSENSGSWSNVITGGDGATITVDLADRSRPGSGETAVRLDFTFGPTPGSWAGLVVSSAPGYWGDGPGPAFDLRPAGRLVFSARGANGGERIRVKVAVAGDATYGDSAPLPFDSGWLTLDSDWRTLQLAFDGTGLQRVVTPFAVIANRANNPAGRATVYLDSIRFAPTGDEGR